MKPQNQSKPVVIGDKPSSAIWADFMAQHKLRTQADLEADGWLWLDDFARSLGMSRPGADGLAHREGMDRTTGKLRNGQRATFLRPRVKP